MGTTALLSSIGNPHVVSLLIDFKANIHHCDKVGLNSLMYCVERHDLESLKLLIEQNVDVNHRSMYGVSVLHLCNF